VLPALAVVAAVLVWGLVGLPDFGHYRGPYGLVLNRVAVDERHVTNVVTAVVFDYRGFDTLGEELILFTAAIAVALLARDVREPQTRSKRDAVVGDAWRAVGLAAVGPVVVLGFYVVAHGTITPGGGFQGGVVLMAGVALIYLAGEYRAFLDLSPTRLVDFVEGAGAAAFVATGLAAIALGGEYLHNFLPFGTGGTLASGGSMVILSVATALEVAAALVLLLHEFLEELVVERQLRK
jgi:multicomponent Na+:H+ antiporter subunit B